MWKSVKLRMRWEPTTRWLTKYNFYIHPSFRVFFTLFESFVYFFYNCISFLKFGPVSVLKQNFSFFSFNLMIFLFYFSFLFYFYLFFNNNNYYYYFIYLLLLLFYLFIYFLLFFFFFLSVFTLSFSPENPVVTFQD